MCNMRTLGRLTAKTVATAKLKPGQKSRMLCDGGCLWLLIRLGEADQIIKSWVFRYATPTPQFNTSEAGKSYRKERSMGLGAADQLALADRPAVNADGTPMLDRDGRQIILPGARTLAAQARALVAQGIDPIEARKVSKSAAAAKQATAMTFAEAADEYVKTHQHNWRNADHRAQWERTLRTQINPVIGSMNAAAVDTQAVLAVLQPIWLRTPETASRIRSRIEVVLDHARVKCGFTWPDGNPARWRGHLDKTFPKRKKSEDVKPQPSLSYEQIAEFMADLRPNTSIAARALQVLILCGTRSGETILATWHEINWDKQTWTIPKEHRKNRRQLVVTLSDTALSVLRDLCELRQGAKIFPVGDRAMDSVLKSMRQADGSPWADPNDGRLVTVHGFRSTLRSWAGDQGYPFDLCEYAIGHRVGDATVQAYERGEKINLRREMMQAWADFIARRPGDNVVKLVSAAA
jgi:integrase